MTHSSKRAEKLKTALQTHTSQALVNTMNTCVHRVRLCTSVSACLHCMCVYSSHSVCVKYRQCSSQRVHH